MTQAFVNLGVTQAMSPNVGNFVHDLVEMAKAMETLPQVQAELDRANSAIESYAKQVQDREIAIISYKDEIEALHSKVRSLEVERDDASFRVMEAEDLTHNTLNRLRAIQTALGGTVDALDPPKPQPEPEVSQPQAVELSQDQSASDPTTVAAVQDTGNTSASATATQSENASTSTHIEEATDYYPNPTTSTSPSGDRPISMPKPYEGQRYLDVPYHVSREDWLAGGGSEENYYYAP